MKILSIYNHLMIIIAAALFSIQKTAIIDFSQTQVTIRTNDSSIERMSSYVEEEDHQSFFY